MHEEYLPTDLDGMLGRIVEEVGEVLQAVGKTQRFGLYSSNPLLPIQEREYNWEWLSRELDDLEHAIGSLRPYLKPQVKAPIRNDVNRDDWGKEWDPQP